MSSENGDADLSQMRVNVETVQSSPSEDLPKMQDQIMVCTQKQTEKVRYRVSMTDFKNGTVLFAEYFTNYDDAEETFNSIEDDKSFIRAYERSLVRLELERSYRAISQIFWESIKISTIYKDS